MKMKSTKSKAVSFDRGVSKGKPSRLRQTVNTGRAASKKVTVAGQKDFDKNETNGHRMSKADQMTLKAWQATYDSRDKFVR